MCNTTVLNVTECTLGDVKRRLPASGRFFVFHRAPRAARENIAVMVAKSGCEEVRAKAAVKTCGFFVCYSTPRVRASLRPRPARVRCGPPIRFSPIDGRRPTRVRFLWMLSRGPRARSAPGPRPLSVLPQTGGAPTEPQGLTPVRERLPAGTFGAWPPPPGTRRPAAAGRSLAWVLGSARRLPGALCLCFILLQPATNGGWRGVAGCVYPCVSVERPGPGLSSETQRGEVTGPATTRVATDQHRRNSVPGGGTRWCRPGCKGPVQERLAAAGADGGGGWFSFATTVLGHPWVHSWRPIGGHEPPCRLPHTLEEEEARARADAEREPALQNLKGRAMAVPLSRKQETAAPQAPHGGQRRKIEKNAAPQAPHGGKGGKIENVAPQAPHGVQRRKNREWRHRSPAILVSLDRFLFEFILNLGGRSHPREKFPLALNAPTADTLSRAIAIIIISQEVAPAPNVSRKGAQGWGNG
eukprot:gene13275-biopygen11055